MNMQSAQPAVQSSAELFRMASDVETVVGKLGALAALLARLTGHTDLVMFSLQYSTEAIQDELQGVCDRLYAAAREQRAAS